MKGEKTIIEGMLIPCLMTGTDEWSNAEIIKIRDNEPSGSTEIVDSDDAKRLYYVHYVDFNKRLDCWVTEDRLDVAKARAKGAQEASDDKVKKEDPDVGSSRCFSPTPSAIKDVSNLGTTPTSGWYNEIFIFQVFARVV